jgi:hypothetical protein
MWKAFFVPKNSEKCVQKVTWQDFPRFSEQFYVKYHSRKLLKGLSRNKEMSSSGISANLVPTLVKVCSLQ